MCKSSEHQALLTPPCYSANQGGHAAFPGSAPTLLTVDVVEEAVLPQKGAGSSVVTDIKRARSSVFSPHSAAVIGNCPSTHGF